MNEYDSPEGICEIAPGITPWLLAQLRFSGKGPRYYKPTPKTVLYSRKEFLEWIESSARYGTAVDAV